MRIVWFFSWVEIVWEVGELWAELDAEFVDAVGYVVEDVEAGNPLLTEEVGSMGIFFFEHGGENVASIDFVLAGKLDMCKCALHQAFEGVGLLEGGVAGDGFELIGEELVEACAQSFLFDAAIFEDFGTSYGFMGTLRVSTSMVSVAERICR